MSYANLMLYSSVIPSYDYDNKDKKPTRHKGIPTNYGDFFSKANLKCKTTKNNVITSYKEDYFFDRKIREDRVLDDLDRFFQN